MTEWRCGDHVGYGLSEYLDQVAVTERLWAVRIVLHPCDTLSVSRRELVPLWGVILPSRGGDPWRRTRCRRLRLDQQGFGNVAVEVEEFAVFRDVFELRGR